MTFNSEEAAFQRLIRARPADTGLRLVFADWLDERSDPRGEFIRVQCALADLPTHHPHRGELARRERELLTAHAAEWGRPWQDVAAGWEFHRGLVECVVLPADRFLDQADELFRRGPVRRVRFTRVNAVLGRLAQSPLLARVSELALCGEDLGAGGANVLARSPYLDRLTWLDLSFNNLTDAGLDRLAAAELPRLRVLLLGENRAGEVGAIALARAPHLGRLTDLDLDGNRLGDAGLKALADSSTLGSLTHLGWRGGEFGTVGVRALARSPLLARLLGRRPILDLRQRRLSAAAAAALACSPAIRGATALHLDVNQLGDDGTAALARSRYLVNLTVLTLAANGIGDDGAAILARARFLSRLERLDLSGNHLTRQGRTVLRHAPALNWRARLDLHGQAPPRDLDNQSVPLAD